MKKPTQSLVQVLDHHTNFDKELKVLAYDGRTYLYDVIAKGTAAEIKAAIPELLEYNVWDTWDYENRREFVIEKLIEEK